MPTTEETAMLHDMSVLRTEMRRGPLRLDHVSSSSYHLADHLRQARAFVWSGDFLACSNALSQLIAGIELAMLQEAHDCAPR
ncbi:MAG: hypothetical protein M5R41_19325 [Bacteroidia bacterium]|nr:hypothetical protein [Bacteroidia bacterium]